MLDALPPMATLKRQGQRATDMRGGKRESGRDWCAERSPFSTSLHQAVMSLPTPLLAPEPRIFRMSPSFQAVKDLMGNAAIWSRLTLRLWDKTTDLEALHHCWGNRESFVTKRGIEALAPGLPPQ